MAGRHEVGGLEAEILAALWASDAALSVSDVTDVLGNTRAYTTVQTILTRLHRKGAVRRVLIGRAHSYTPVLDDAGLAAQKMRSMLDRGDDQLGVLRRFVETLTPEEEAAVTELLDRKPGRPTDSRGRTDPP